MHPDTPRGKYVCTCIGLSVEKRCGKECPGYESNAIENKMILNRNKANEGLLVGLKNALSKTNPPERFGGGMGDGIVYVGGGKYWPGIVVGVKLLRENGYDGPIEVWYRGDIEPVNEKDVAGDMVTFINTLEIAERYADSSSFVKTVKGKYGGWAAKSYALMYTNLDRVLYLDADAYCVSSPTPLFKELNKSPFVFWSDLPHQTRTLRWNLVYPEHNGDGIPPVQGGQLLIDRHSAFKMLNAFHYICQNGDKYWISEGKQRRTMYGDQDAWRVGMADKACGWHSIGKAHWDKVAFVCHYQGSPVVVHRCQSKLFTHDNIPERNQRYAAAVASLPQESRVFEIFGKYCHSVGYDSKFVFNNIYHRGLWGGGSGAGSTLREGQLYIDCVNTLFLTNPDIKTAVDLGSGDGLLGSHLKVDKYIGIDASAIIVELCQTRYPQNTYMHLDFSKEIERIPDGDILLCKDVFHHWPNDMVKAFFEQLSANNRWKHWLFCCDDRVNNVTDCNLGGYRAIRLDSGDIAHYGLKRIQDVHHKGLYYRRF